ncbi:glycosyltransferase family 2 protein [Sphingobacterium hotanense]|uniref:glycosyltransferase family 2 protein n=1 Tax=Sphingobacterium hotanense TaxID=649196 RepID=UPI001659E6DE|nr:glycosyltransferase family A protein [Sphingobacterium hotanense]
MEQPLVSIIIPVYGVERFISKCLTSVLNQTYDALEIIIIDDATQDRSIELAKQLLNEYPNRTNSTVFIKHEVNQGLPSARNTGLKNASGIYVLHIDSDDWIENDMVEKMVESAISKDLDIVYSDWFLSFRKNERYMKQPSFIDPKECIDAFLNGSLRFNVWNKLVKRSIYLENNILFPDGKPMGEDMTMIKVFCHARSIGYVPGAFYHYVQLNPNAYTKQFSEEKFLQVVENTKNVIEYIETRFPDGEYSRQVHFFKLNVKLPLLIGSEVNKYAYWKTVFSESNVYIKANKAFGWRIKLVQLAALNAQFWLVKLHYFIIIKFIYGFVYR